MVSVGFVDSKQQFVEDFIGVACVCHILWHVCKRKNYLILQTHLVELGSSRLG